MVDISWDFVRGFALLLWLNLKHYLAGPLLGFRLKLDPDYPNEPRFRGDLIVDSVFEYRLYCLFAPWCIFLALVLPLWTLPIIAGLWTGLTWNRTFYYSTPFRFWTRAYQESPTKHRNRIRYAEQIALEIERKDKAGARWDSPEMQELITTGMNLQEQIIKGENVGRN